MDALYIVRKGRGSSALTYSLRSLEACFPVDHVFFMGSPDGDWQVKKVEGNFDQGDKWYNLDVAWRHMPNVDELSNPFIYMNDDFFLLKSLMYIPTFHRGPLSEKPPYDNYGVDRFQVSLFLEQHGYTMLDFELHIPMVIYKEKVAQLYDSWGSRPVHGHQRSLYGNIAQLEAKPMGDVKIRDITEDTMADMDLFVSCDPTSWFRHPIFKEVRRMYDKPCRWEVP